MAVQEGARMTSQQSGGFRRLFEPLEIGDFTVRNRIVVTTHGTGLGEARDLRYLQERARGGAGLLGIHSSGGVYGYAVGPGPRSATPDWDDKGLSPVTPEGVAHYDEGYPPGPAPPSRSRPLRGGTLLRPGLPLGCSATWHQLERGDGSLGGSGSYEGLSPHPLTEHEIEELVVAFAHAIRRPRRPGSTRRRSTVRTAIWSTSFLSPYFNRRTDRWGATRADRVRFVLAVITEARAMVGPDFPIGIRVGVDGDGEHRGLTVDELIEVCRLLGPHVAYVSVSGGNYAGFR